MPGINGGLVAGDHDERDAQLKPSYLASISLAGKTRRATTELPTYRVTEAFGQDHNARSLLSSISLVHSPTSQEIGGISKEHRLEQHKTVENGMTEGTMKQTKLYYEYF